MIKVITTNGTFPECGDLTVKLLDDCGNEIGFAGLTTINGQTNINNLFVEPLMRQQGFGSLVLYYLMYEAIGNGITIAKAIPSPHHFKDIPVKELNKLFMAVGFIPVESDITLDEEQPMIWER